MRKHKLLVLLFAAITLSIAACKPTISSDTPPELTSQTLQATITLTLTPSLTPSPTNTVSPTPTPTATAIPLTIQGNLRGYALRDPVPEPGAPCGLVDIFDFPLNPPHGENARGGGDFGIYRSRYDKYHSGEDWRLSSGFSGSSFGEPVFVIGHGQVTYAEPEGWGADKGVVIVQHTFSNGSRILSFYGHLDPPSVTLARGDCVWRGDRVGNIGRPRTPPHLHFEIRSHFPVSPGPGYWSSDPAQAGWFPPSQTIWKYRILANPAVQWMRSPSENFTKGLGMLDDQIFVLFEDLRLKGIDITNGETRWSFPIPDATNNALLSPDHDLVFISTRFGELAAYKTLSTQRNYAEYDPEWSVTLDAYRNTTLMPLPDGGLVITGEESAYAFSHTGDRLWHIDIDDAVSGWVEKDGELIFSSGGDIWQVDAANSTTWQAGTQGKLANSGERLFLLSENGVYVLDMDAQTTEKVLELPHGFPRLGDIAPSPDGGVLITHTDTAGRRLIALNSDGSLRWERSFAGQSPGQVNFLGVEDKIYLVSEHSDSSGSRVNVYRIDSESAELSQIFEGGTRSAIAANTWYSAVSDDLILLNIGGGEMIFMNSTFAWK